MRAGATRVAGVVLLLALLGEPSPAAEGDPWQTAHVQSVLGLWAGARAEQLIGQTKTAVRLYRLAEEQADKSFQRSVPPLERMILTELSKRIKAALAKLSQNGEGLTDQLRRPQHVIADLVRLKAQADLDRAKLRTDDARVRYEVLAHAARLVRRRFPQSDQAKAAAWLESRARASVLQLAQRPAEGLPQRQRFIGDFKHFATRSLAGDLLHVFHPKVPGPVRFRESARPSPPRVPGVSSVVAALEQAGPFRIVWGPTKLVAAGGVTLMQECIAPLPAADPGAPDVPARVADAAAKIYLEGLSGDTKLLDSPAAVRDALDTIRGAGVRKQALVNLANILAAKKTGAAPGGITMGAPALPDQTLRPALLETYLHVLQTSPELDQSGALTRKALGACVQLGRLDARAAVLKERLRKGPPGLLGVLLYRVLRADRRNRAASDLLVMMLGDPDRFFPQSLASTEALSDGFQLLRSSMKLDVARSAAEVLARREPSGAPRRLLLLAEAHLAAKRREEARTLLAKLVADYPLAPEASRAAALLVPEKPATGELAKQLLTDDQLAALAKLARANPLQYMRLADEYRRARH